MYNCMLGQTEFCQLIASGRRPRNGVWLDLSV